MKYPPILDKILLRERAVLETIIDLLKKVSQIEHTRHRGLWSFLGALVAGLFTHAT